MEKPMLLDANIFLRHLRQDHPTHSPLATALLTEIEQRKRRVRVLETVVFEVVFTLQSYYKEPRLAISRAVLPLLELPGIVLPGKRWMRQVFNLYIQEPRLSFADCYHVISIKRLKLSGIISFDQELDRVPSVVRHEP